MWGGHFNLSSYPHTAPDPTVRVWLCVCVCMHVWQCVCVCVSHGWKCAFQEWADWFYSPTACWRKKKKQHNIWVISSQTSVLVRFPPFTSHTSRRQAALITTTGLSGNFPKRLRCWTIRIIQWLNSVALRPNQFSPQLFQTKVVFLLNLGNGCIHFYPTKGTSVFLSLFTSFLLLFPFSSLSCCTHSTWG